LSHSLTIAVQEKTSFVQNESYLNQPVNNNNYHTTKFSIDTTNGQLSVFAKTELSSKAFPIIMGIDTTLNEGKISEGESYSVVNQPISRNNNDVTNCIVNASELSSTIKVYHSIPI